MKFSSQVMWHHRWRSSCNYNMFGATNCKYLLVIGLNVHLAYLQSKKVLRMFLVKDRCTDSLPSRITKCIEARCRRAHALLNLIRLSYLFYEQRHSLIQQLDYMIMYFPFCSCLLPKTTCLNNFVNAYATDQSRNSCIMIVVYKNLYDWSGLNNFIFIDRIIFEHQKWIIRFKWMM